MSLAREREESARSPLTRKEKDLLEVLEGNPGCCFSRSYLLKRIWGYANDAKTRTVDVHVSRLRKKLEGRRDVAIHAVLGQGYILQKGNGPIGPGSLNGTLGGDQAHYTPPKMTSAMII